MSKSPPRKLTASILFVAVAAIVMVADLWTKEAVFEFLKVQTEGDPPRVVQQERYVVIDGFFWLEANYNYGAFSGWFADYTSGLAALSAVAALVLTAIFVVHVWKYSRPHRLFVLALALLLGGTVGNFYDRAFLNGVRDWIRWFLVIDGKEHVWPNFNIGDSAICSGVALLVLLEIIRWRQEVRAARKKKAAVPES